MTNLINEEFISAAIGLVFTLMIFSYLLKDNALFRIALNIFVGVASGYAAMVVVYSVLIPRLSQLESFGDLVLVVIPMLLGLSLLAKVFPRISWMGNFAMAVLVGVGAATAIGGALIGSLIPQAQAATELGAKTGRLGEGLVMLVGTVFTLAAFHFSAGRAADGAPKRIALVEGVAWFGRIFVAITLGALFAGVYMAALTAMIERLSSNINFIRQMIGI